MENNCANNDLDVLEDHLRAPRNMGKLAMCNGYARITGPCGDTMEFSVYIEDGSIVDLVYTTDGCALSIAAGSMTSCLADNRKVPEILLLRAKSVVDALRTLPESHHHCALLAVTTLHAACENYYKRNLLLAAEMAHSTEQQHDRLEAEKARSALLSAKLARIDRKYVVLSGKGGVGKSSVAVNVAFDLVMRGYRVGLLDADLHGPSVPTMLGIESKRLDEVGQELLPVELGRLKVVSVGFLLSGPEDALIWRGPRKHSALKQFLTDVQWGDLDYLIVDCPPGTGDEALAVCQLIDDIDGAVLVTTPQKVAEVDVRRSVEFCKTLSVAIVGIVENMNGFVCPACGEVSQIFGSGAGRSIATDKNIPFLTSIPIEPRVVESSDQGRCVVHLFPDSLAAVGVNEITDSLIQFSKTRCEASEEKETQQMKIAIPLTGGLLAEHFGHCETFALLEIDSEKNVVLNQSSLDSPPHQPGMLPAWLAERGANVVIAGGMGQRAHDLFAEQGIKVVIGAKSDSAEKIVADYMEGKLEVGENTCDH